MRIHSSGFIVKCKSCGREATWEKDSDNIEIIYPYTNDDLGISIACDCGNKETITGDLIKLLRCNELGIKS